MFTNISPSLRSSSTRVLIALVLCYAMLVQGLAAHFTQAPIEPSALHTLCLSAAESSSQNPSPDKPAPDHSRHAPCCLIFGNGDVPRFVPLVSTLVFEITFAIYPLAEFSNPIDDSFDYSPALPRAPPRMG